MKPNFNSVIFISKLNLRNSFNHKILRNFSVNNNNYQEFNYKRVNKSENNYSRVHPYRELFEWKSMYDFVRVLAENIVYNDNKLIAISKPWGVGIHKSFIQTSDQNSHLLYNQIIGEPKFCIDYALEPLSQLINVPKLKCVKSVDRFMSGIILLTTDELTEKRVLKSIRRAKPMEKPYMKYLCITKGYPVIDGQSLRERVGIKLIETDELGDYKESIIINENNLNNGMRRRHKPQSDGLCVKPILSEMKIIDRNKKLAVGLVELSITDHKWHFISCYLANKASFVIGDERYSRRVKHVLGTPMSSDPRKLNFNDNVEALPQNICRELQVRGNAFVPEMIHHKSITLTQYNGKNDLIITAKPPKHFGWTLNRLGLKEVNNEELTETENLSPLG